jgi:hypothetical protein
LATPVLFLIAAAVIANLVVMAVIVVPPLIGRRSPLGGGPDLSIDIERRAAEGLPSVRRTPVAIEVFVVDAIVRASDEQIQTARLP